MIGAFEFEHGGRRYRCVPERMGDGSGGCWWWFAVSYDQQRYAPFEAVSGDTRQSVRDRIIAFYEHRLWVRAQPPEPRQRFSGPGRPPSAAKAAGAARARKVEPAAKQRGAASGRPKPRS